MDFFDQQKRARQRTALLGIYFLLAVLAVVAALNLIVWLVFSSAPLSQWWRNPAAHWLTLAVVAVIVSGSLHKAWQLRANGQGLAGLLGAHAVPPRPDSPEQRQLRAVVEEISIAAGTPMPRLYVLPDETTINAMVAGLTPARAALVVTAGALRALERNELQGMVAHEFSHILNGDMRLNLRMMAVLAGLLAVGKLGLYLCAINTRPHRHGGLLLFGLPLVMAGYAGLFCGRLIRAAISRQREQLADASAVQFTRQPAGLAGALIKIRQGQGSHLRSRHAEDLNHMGFAATVPLRLRHWFATHPDIGARLAALGPDWPARARARSRAATTTASAALSSHVGALSNGGLGYAHTLLESLPTDLRQALATQEGAECVLYTLALGPLKTPPALRDGHRAALVAQVRALGTRLRLPLLDLALATLRPLPSSRRWLIIGQLRAIAQRRPQQDLLCWALSALAEKGLAPAGRALTLPVPHRLGAVASELQVLFSALAWAGGSSRGTVLGAFLRATHGLLPPGRQLLTPDRCTAPRLDSAITRLNRLSPILKAPVIDAAADLVLADGQVQVAEAELMRALCALIECPMPPLFPGAAPGRTGTG